MICKNCGSQIPEKETICPVCHTPAGTDSEVMYTSSYVNKQKEQQQKRRICLIAGIIILVCAPLGVALGLKLSGGNPAPTDGLAIVDTLPPTSVPTLPPVETPVPDITSQPPIGTPYVMTPKPGDITDPGATNPTPTPKSDLPTGKDGYITGDGVRFRSGPSTNGTTVYDTIRKNAKVTVVSSANGWTKIVYNDKVGYVSSEYVTTKKPEEGTAKPTKTPVPDSTYTPTESDCIGRVVSKGLFVRGGPGMSYDPILTLKNGAEFVILEDVRGWYRIVVNGKEGYVGGSDDLVEIIRGTVPD